MNNTENLEEKYPFIINELMEFIIEVKKRDNEQSSLIDIIMEYCLKKDLDIEMFGDAIRDDIYFMSFIEKDIESRIKQVEEW